MTLAIDQLRNENILSSRNWQKRISGPLCVLAIGVLVAVFVQDGNEEKESDQKNIGGNKAALVNENKNSKAELEAQPKVYSLEKPKENKTNESSFESNSTLDQMLKEEKERKGKESPTGG